jgi:hypothetical protein
MSSYCRYWPTECCLASSWSAYDEILRPRGLIAMVAVTMFNWPSVARMLHSREVPQGTPQNDEMQRISHHQMARR